MKKTIKIIMFWLSMICIVIGIKGKALAISTNESVELEISYGLDNHIRVQMDRDVVLKISITNKGEDLNGILQVKGFYSIEGKGYYNEFGNNVSLVPGIKNGIARQRQYVQEEDVVLQSGEVKEYTMTIPYSLVNEKLKVCLLDDFHEEIVKEDLLIESENLVYIGILEEKQGQYTYPETLSNSYNSAIGELVSIPYENLLDLDLLKQIDFMIVTDSRLKNATAQEKLCLEQWVKDGGNILIGGFYKKTDKDLPFISEPDLFSAIDINLDERQEQTKGVVSYQYYEGRVHYIRSVYENYDNDIKGGIYESIGGLDWNEYLSTDHLMRLMAEYFCYGVQDMIPYSNTVNYSWKMKEILDHVDLANHPNIYKYLMIVVIYIILIGPVLYGYLKVRKRRNDLWKYMILGSLATMCMIYIVSGDSRQKGPVIKYLQIQEYKGDQQKEKVYLNISAPFIEPFNIYIKPEYNVQLGPMTNPIESEDLAKISEDNYHVNIHRSEEESEIQLTNLPINEGEDFLLTREEEETKELKTNISMKDGKFYGTVENLTGKDLQHAFIYEENYFVSIGDLDAGETVDVSAYETYYYPMERILSNEHGFYELLAPHMDESDINDHFFLETIYYLVESEIYNIPKLVAFEKEHNNLDVQADWQYQTYGTTVHMKYLEVKKKQGDQIYIPNLPMTSPNFENKSFLDYPNRGFDYTTMYDGFIEVNYLIDPNIVPETLKVMIPSLTPETLHDAPIKYMHLFNINTEEYDIFTVENMELSREVLSRYISSDHEIQVVYSNSKDPFISAYSEETSTEGYYEGLLPNVALTGKEAGK
ncbi:MAG TPA: hypothetical protein IAC41_07575 [Candidatus Merdenecus merdavium]|nr:hypothetical protein [Candidatus Merdenecus merdavium]